MYGYQDEAPATIELRPNVTSTEIVHLKRIDEFMEENNIEHVDLLKIDVEGAEYGIFSSGGLEKVKDKIDYIIGEAHYYYSLEPEYINLMLDDLGYEVEWLPFNNMYKGVKTHNIVTDTYKTWQFNVQSIFFARKKQNG